MAKICLECIKENIEVIEVGDLVVEKEKCSNCSEEETHECFGCDNQTTNALYCDECKGSESGRKEQ